MDEDATEIAITKGTAARTRRYGLTEAQRTGQACLVCQGTETVTTDVGWIGDVQVKVHSYHLGQYQLGKTIPPQPAADVPDRHAGVALDLTATFLSIAGALGLGSLLQQWLGPVALDHFTHFAQPDRWAVSRLATGPART